ncbi:MAG: hypothetical protein DKM50_01545 [Candidatus Margulisiibacteriota bacterium]|nr:MAG: hypothetical protein A2X43_08265 [Candidatus Margulisbacteria bacterium GWD2_39_127]OGI03130.1 MAG: hypothetical protein A2X42_10905 [Candidatus Margulisbacteria bacterium GWF2_38_17]OGI11667.1 MAG: hypothetical protein A2X41_10285 [Candidatus Margulisbacteria bacterium GWE2_39_32]PZM83787.1 MAG: hypothetical protein DKM50_01545 [Candidatus Margulisiibacteriota bacterium]HAR63021.1 hypothetical protein [Candidatus Margulisiibacteriota bacterium]
MNNIIKVIGIMLLSISVAGCANIFKSMEQLDSADKLEKAELAKQNGDSAAVESFARDVLQQKGADYSVPTKGATLEEKQARTDLAMVELSKIGSSPVDVLKNVIQMSGSSNNLSDDFYTRISDTLPPTRDLGIVLIAAGNLRKNADISNPNEALNAAAAETTAVTMIVTSAFDANGDGRLTDDENIATSDMLARWDSVSTNLLEHSQGAIDMFGYTNEGGNNQGIKDASNQLNQLQELNASRGLKTGDEFVASLNAIFGF